MRPEANLRQSPASPGDAGVGVHRVLQPGRTARCDVARGPAAPTVAVITSFIVRSCPSFWSLLDLGVARTSTRVPNPVLSQDVSSRLHLWPSVPIPLRSLVASSHALVRAPGGQAFEVFVCQQHGRCRNRRARMGLFRRDGGEPDTQWPEDEEGVADRGKTGGDPARR